MFYFLSVVFVLLSIYFAFDAMKKEDTFMRIGAYGLLLTSSCMFTAVVYNGVFASQI